MAGLTASMKLLRNEVAILYFQWINMSYKQKLMSMKEKVINDT